MARKFKESKELLELKRIIAESENIEETEEEYWERLDREFKERNKGIDGEDKEIKMYREMMDEKYRVNDYMFEDISQSDLYAQAGYFQNVKTKSEAKERYKELIKYFHPDKSTGNEEKFRNIQEAWEMAQSYLSYIEKVQGVDITSKEFCETIFSK
jgi:hypothetical protein